MTAALRLQKLISQVQSKLQAEGIDFQDYDNAIKCLEKTVNPNLCIGIYETHIYY